MNDTPERDQPDQVPPGGTPPPDAGEASDQQWPPPSAGTDEPDGPAPDGGGPSTAGGAAHPASEPGQHVPPHPPPDAGALPGPAAPPDPGAPPDNAAPSGGVAPPGAAPSGGVAPPGAAPPHAPPSQGGYQPGGYSASPYGWHNPPPPKPGVIPLRPLNLGDIIDGAVSAMRSYPRVMLGVAAIVIAAAQLITVPIQWLLRPSQADLAGDPETAGEVFATLNGDLIALGILLLAQVFLTGFLTVVVGRAVVARPASFADVWAEVKPRLLALIGLTLVTTVLAFVAVFAVTIGFVVVIVGVVATIGTGDAGFGMAMLIIVVAALAIGGLAMWVVVRLVLATPALVLERTGLRGAMQRSWRLVGGTWWRIFGIWVLAYLIANVLASIITIPFMLIGGGGAGLFGDGEAAEVTFTMLLFAALGNVIAYALTLPFQAGVSALLYTDQRIRREGLDIELARSAGSGSR